MMKPRFLLVDDDELLLTLLARGLSRHGFEVVSATSSAQALEIAQNTRIDYAILDLKLSQETSLPLLQPLLALHGECKILMLTGYASVTTAVDAIKRGAYHYLSKPASIEEILTALDLSSESGAACEIEALEPASVNRVEWEHIQKVLQQEGGNISATARKLGMHRRTLQRKLFKHPTKN